MWFCIPKLEYGVMTSLLLNILRWGTLLQECFFFGRVQQLDLHDLLYIFHKVIALFPLDILLGSRSIINWCMRNMNFVSVIQYLSNMSTMLIYLLSDQFFVHYIAWARFSFFDIVYQNYVKFGYTMMGANVKCLSSW